MSASTSTSARLAFIAPFFIVRDVMASIAFYRDRLGFEVEYIGPDGDPFYGMVQRDDVCLMLKAITPDVQPVPNPARHPWAAWDAYVGVPDPDALAEEFAARGVTFRDALGVNSDNLRGFTVADADGYVLYFGRPA
jgi:catechol 2,3-dioxygenase-like lactoylglutathione lyase family enzyme